MNLRPFIFILFFSATACDFDKVPAQVKMDFEIKYPDAKKVTWSKDSHGQYEAKFKWQGNKLRADFGGATLAWVETEMNMAKKDLPKMVKAIIDEVYTSYEISEIEFVDHHSKGVFYDVEFKLDGEHVDVEIDSSGNIIGFE